MSSFAVTWAIHIADGVLDWPWLVAGFVVTGVLALVASWRVREEEVPRIALLTAAFFVASSIHVKLPPTSVHLLLNGLVGVVLGCRAPLAILVGVALQALLIPHGGLTTIGVNAAVATLPALAAAAFFPALRSWLRTGRTWRRSLLVGGSALVWGGLLVLAAVILATNPWRDLVQVSADAGVVFAIENFRPARDFLLHPVTLVLLAAFALACVWMERQLENAPEFPAGAFVGTFAVIGTTILAGLVLLVDGVDRWSTFVSAVFLAHLPLALVEGFILGVTVGFLASVKPDMLTPLPIADRTMQKEEVRERLTLTSARDGIPIALLACLLLGQPVYAHQLKVDAKIDVHERQVTIESWYEAGDPPKEATAKVLREDGSVLAEGALDGRGAFVFTYDHPAPLRIEITAPGGHRASLKLSAKELGGGDEARPPQPRESGTRLQDVLLGVTFLLALAAFVLSCRNARQLRAPGASKSEPGA